MFRRCVKVFKIRYSYYVRWNILCCWIFGLWMALCTSDMYRLNWNHERNISFEHATKAETMESLHYVIVPNNDPCNVLLKSEEVIGFIEACIFLSFVIITACTHKHIRKRVDRVHEVLFGICRIAASSADTCSASYSPDEKLRLCTNDVNNAKSLQVNCREAKEFIEQYVNSEFDERILDGNDQSVSESEYKLYDDANDEESENQDHAIEYAMLLTDTESESDLPDDDSKTGNDSSVDAVSVSETKEKINCGTMCGYDIKTRVISSSPEFQKFLWNLKGARFSSQYMLGVYKVRRVRYVVED